MKSLVESLFDKDIVSSPLQVEKVIKSMTYHNMKGMSDEEGVNNTLSIVNSAKQYNTNELKKTPIDLSKNILIVKRTKLRNCAFAEEVCKYVYYYEQRGNVVKTSLQNKFKGGFYWDALIPVTDWESVKKYWIRFVSRLNKYWGDGIEFYVLDESLSKKLKISIDTK